MLSGFTQVGIIPITEAIVIQEPCVEMQIPFKMVVYAVGSHIALLIINWKFSLKFRLLHLLSNWHSLFVMS
ncbi:hypothetical protein EEL36_13370 [Muribaculaceae bacterium Isolate-043 (Harlan)]|nr:hypothetical protein EEL36_13370 [Muribaculaceae bacterium Isolate-043 (Harlan)]